MVVSASEKTMTLPAFTSGCARKRLSARSLSSSSAPMSWTRRAISLSVSKSASMSLSQSAVLKSSVGWARADFSPPPAPSRRSSSLVRTASASSASKDSPASSRAAVAPTGTYPRSSAARKLRLLRMSAAVVERNASMLDSSRFSSSAPISCAMRFRARNRSRYSGLPRASFLIYCVALYRAALWLFSSACSSPNAPALAYTLSSR